MKERTAIVLSLVWLLMGAAAWANDDGESRWAEVVLEASEIDSSRKEHIQVQANSSRDEVGLQVRSDSLSGRMARGGCHREDRQEDCQKVRCRCYYGYSS